jgi:hypothetical protein
MGKTEKLFVRVSNVFYIFVPFIVVYYLFVFQNMYILKAR